MKPHSFMRDTGDHRDEDVRRSRSVNHPRYVERGQYNYSVGGVQDENPSRSRRKVMATTTCTLCQEVLHSQRDLQAHLASPIHLDMVVRYPMLSLQDILISELGDTSFTLEPSQDGREIFAKLGSSMLQSIGDMHVVSKIYVHVRFCLLSKCSNSSKLAHSECIFSVCILKGKLARFIFESSSW